MKKSFSGKREQGTLWLTPRLRYRQAQCIAGNREQARGKRQEVRGNGLRACDYNFPCKPDLQKLLEKFFGKYMDILEIGSYNGLLDTKCKSSDALPSDTMPLHPNTLGI